MAPNKRGGSLSSANTQPEAIPDGSNGSVITKEEIAARGAGTTEIGDSYDPQHRFRSELRVALTGVMFLTRLPVPAWVDHHPAYLMRAGQWFPLIGTVVGLWAAVWLTAAAVAWPPGLAAAVSTLAAVWLTGCFHEDGLADCFDGFGGGWGKSQILRIMKDRLSLVILFLSFDRVGTYALVGMVLVLTMKLRCLETLLAREGEAIDAASALVAAHTLSRWTSLPLIYFCKYIEDEEDAKGSMYSPFARCRALLTLPRILFGTSTAALVSWYALTVEHFLIVWGTTLFVTLSAGYYGNQVIGGVIGDYLGATIQVAELCIYLALVANWHAFYAQWQPIAALAAASAIPIAWTRFKGGDFDL